MEGSRCELMARASYVPDYSITQPIVRALDQAIQNAENTNLCMQASGWQLVRVKAHTKMLPDGSTFGGPSYPPAGTMNPDGSVNLPGSPVAQAIATTRLNANGDPKFDFEP